MKSSPKHRACGNISATDRGGFVGYVEEYGCMGMSEANYRACGEAFRRLHTAVS